MRLSTRGRFAINAMIDLALREDAAPVPLAELAARHQISLSYLEQVFAKLRQHGLVESTRGPGGGYTQSTGAHHVTVADIITAIEDPQSGEGHNEDPHSVNDMTQDLWKALQSTLMAHMKTITLQSLASEQKHKGVTMQARKKRSKGVFAPFKPEPVRTNAPNSVFALAQTMRLTT